MRQTIGSLLVVGVCAFGGYLVGLRYQRYSQARADVRDTEDKLSKARKARAELRLEAVTGFLGLCLGLALAGYLVSLVR